jgi:hypothetical protein
MNPGHPKKGETREKLKQILFKADRETLEALDELEAAEEHNGRRSHIIREAIKEARKRLKGVA